ncbi:MAG TPA: AAA family ATPase [Clostridia bacterium]|nr:AAA family ATPase [Clostridia bacterium]
MRISGIEIANYRGFAGNSFRLTLGRGENLLVYGENGAGKSSLYNTLKDFLDAATYKNVNIEQRRNRDNPAGAPSIRITTMGNPAAAVEWTPAARGQDTDNWRTLDDGKGFLDYRILLRFYNAPQDSSGRIELFDLLLNGMLANHRMEIPGTPGFLSEWRAITRKKDYHLYEGERQELRQRVARFNTAFKDAAISLARRASALLHDFDPNIGIAFIPERDADFDWYPKCVSKPQFFAEITRPEKASIIDYHEMFNEARLSAMAICLFFAALETCPIEGPRLLVLDDVLIGLDMGNRRKVVDLVQRLFPDWQIIILTYHKAWFEVLKERIKVGDWAGNQWRSILIRPEIHQQSGLLTIAHEDSGTSLETADLALARRDYKAAAVYARTALEAIFHHHAERLNLAVHFKKDQHTHDTDDFLIPFENRFEHLIDPLRRAQAKALVAELRFIRRTVLNAYAHADEISQDELAGEVDHGIAVVRQLEAFLEALQKGHFFKTPPETKLPWQQLIALATVQAAAGSYAGAGNLLKQATAVFVFEYPEAVSLSIPFKRNPTFNHMFNIVFSLNEMDPDEARAFLQLIPYFCGSYEPSDFKPHLFDKTIQLIHLKAYRRLMAVLDARARQLVVP